MDFTNPIARKKLGVDESWEIFKWQRLDSGDMLVEGGIFRLLTRGPRKGQKTWDNRHGQTCVITRAEHEAALAAYENETGKCNKCEGSGQEWHGWDHIQGDLRRPCSRCNGIGSAPSAAASAARQEPTE